MESWLKRLGFHAVEHYTMVDNGAAAVEAFVGAYRAGVPYDLVLLDLMMPTMGGIEACSLMRAFVEEQRLVANGRNAMSITMDEGTEAELYAPFIAAVTASVTEDDRLATRRVGFDRFFEKPFHCEKLRELVKELMMGAQHTA
jgi:CheY-like chemotaxis protein